MSFQLKRIGSNLAYVGTVLNSSGGGLTGETITLILQRSSDSFYWNNSTQLWQVGVPSAYIVADIGSGRYKITLTGAYTADVFQYITTYAETGVFNRTFDEEIEIVVDVDEAKIDALQSDVTAIKAKTDNLPSDPASETNATSNAAALSVEHGALNTNIDDNETKIDAVKVDTAAIKAKTDNLPADPASNTNVDANETKIDAVKVDTAAIKAKTDGLNFTGNNVDAQIKATDDIGLSDTQKTDVLAEARKPYHVETIPELTGVGDIPAEPTPAQAQMLTFMERKNGQFSNSDEHHIFDDNGDVILEQDIAESETIATGSKLRNPD